MDAGGLHPHEDLPYSPTQLMKEFILGAKDYHCSGCLSGPTVLDKYLNFIFKEVEKRKLNPTGNGVNR